MTYGLDRILPEGPEAAEAFKPRRVGFGRWRSLDPRSRLLLVERELKPANDMIDGFPPAL